MIPVGIVLLLFEVIIEFVVEIIEAGFLFVGGLGDRQVFFVTSILFFFFGFIGTFGAARAELLPGQGGSGQWG